VLKAASKVNDQVTHIALQEHLDGDVVERLEK
jgi:hypothetical protein